MSMMEMSKMEKSRMEMSEIETPTLCWGQILPPGCVSGNFSTLSCYFGPSA